MVKKKRKIGIISGKGGVGKTTIVSNLGAALAKKFNKNVAVVDCNLTTSHLSLSLGMYYCPVTLNHLLRGETELKEAMYEHPSGMKIVPASIRLGEIEGVDSKKLKHVIKELHKKADIILLDSAPGLGNEAISAIEASDEIIFVTNPNIPAVTDVIKCKEIIKGLGKRPVGVVMNMVSKKRHELSRKEVEILTELPVIASIPHDNNVQVSLAKRSPLVLHKPRSSASREMKRLAGHLIGIKEDTSFKGRIKRFLGTD
ncbi:MAG: cell division ATPase MinD [Candidatus Aenigmarchaeota archaeon]|nr:cell division ATPase MinD [Candidatus Aenigmarchaeota archaeon]